MLSNYFQKWIIILHVFIPSVNLQFPYPMAGPIFAMPPPPLPIAVPVPVPVMVGSVGKSTTTTTTTTTTKSPYSLGQNGLDQIPLPVQISIFPQGGGPRFPYPAPMPAPAFPVAVPAPPPLVFISRPKPKRHGRPNRPNRQCSSEESKSEDSSSDCDHPKRKRRRRKKVGYVLKRPKYSRKMVFDREMDDNELVKPVFTYVSKNGDVKLKRKLSADEAAALMESSDEKVNVRTDVKNKSRFSVSNNNEGNSITHRKRQIILRTGSSQQTLDDGKKELIFNPPPDSKISNLTVSFQISPIENDD